MEGYFRFLRWIYLEVYVLQKKLVVVESPAKAKTIGKILGRNYKVVASVGHVRDLPKSTLGIDVENNFEPKYITIRGKGPIVQDLKRHAKKADKIFLATDPDREGEAISWHLAHVLKLDENDSVRVEFNEITKEAIKRAMKNPRQIDLNLVDAQQARRMLDRLVGYKISPLLWRKIRKGLSAGRVQSVALKLICDREVEINNFKPEEYWSIVSNLKKNKETFEAKFYGEFKDKKEHKIELKSKSEVDEILDRIDKNNFVVSDVKKGKKRRNPYLPYTTSTMQQDASRRLRFTTKKTMMLAQQLYEGIDIKGEASGGLITYMRTDSTRISDTAVDVATSLIKEKYGDEYSNGGKTYSKKKKKDQQDAHEAIRPTDILKEPDKIKSSLTKDQYNLYKMIWERLMASQMKPAVYDTYSVVINSNDIIFKANGSILSFEGFLKVYEANDQEEKDSRLPRLEKGDKLSVKDITPNQHFTKPPGRYSEASLIKVLEELGIGRPSTFSPTIGTIIARNYVEFEKRTFMPTELGVLVNDLLVEYFKEVINEEFTADLEEKLDEIADGNLTWRQVVADFYVDFDVLMKKADKEIEEIEIKDEVTDIPCEKCGEMMVIKHGRYGKFLACPAYPDCKNTKAIVEKIDVKCPKCGGEVIKRKSKKGRVFYGCNKYPECDFVSWNQPVEKKCPECSSLMVIKKSKKGNKIECTNKDCKYSESVKS